LKTERLKCLDAEHKGQRMFSWSMGLIGKSLWLCAAAGCRPSRCCERVHVTSSHRSSAGQSLSRTDDVAIVSVSTLAPYDVASVLQ